METEHTNDKIADGLASAPTSSSLEVKNCNNCKYLEWYEEQGSWAESGYVCNYRNYPNVKSEDQHLDQLCDSAYRARPKKCCEPRSRTID
jgi:hypothetical protein